MTMEKQPSEEEIARMLVTRIQAGERAAEAELVERYGHGVDYHLSRLTRDKTSREDLVQDTLKLVIEKIRAGEIRNPELLPRFIRNTARNLYIADYRKKKRRGEPDSLDAVAEPANPGEDPQLAVQRRQEAALVRAVIENLGTERDRHLLYRFYIVQDDKLAICADLEVDPVIFNRILHRARDRFKELWQKTNTRGGGSHGRPIHYLILFLDGFT